MVDGKQYSVRGISKCYNGSAEIVQLNQLPRHHEEEVTGLASSSTPQSQELLIDPSPRCIPLHIALALCDIIVARFPGQNNAIHPEGGT